jgi:muramoyltetrapeptide carboxypeptidase
MIKPKRLVKGDSVGIVSVSSPVKQDVIDRSIEYLSSLGFNVVIGDNIEAQRGYMAGSPEERIHDLHKMFEREDIKAIFCAYGGTSANHLLSLIDYNMIRHNPKIFMGMSDPSVIVLAIHSLANLVTFHGPTGYNFGEGGMTSFTEEFFLKTIMTLEPLGAITNSKWVSLKEGGAEGRIIGGNLTLLQSLLGTPYEPNWEGAILFWEDLFVEYHTIDLILTQFEHAGILKKIQGMIVGTLVECQETEYDTDETLEEIILRLTRDYDFPVLMNVDLGHTDDKITIPIGVKVELDSKSKLIVFEETGVI